VVPYRLACYIFRNHFVCSETSTVRAKDRCAFPAGIQSFACLEREQPGLMILRAGWRDRQHERHREGEEGPGRGQAGIRCWN
jgi:hypothetical protein